MVVSHFVASPCHQPNHRIDEIIRDNTCARLEDCSTHASLSFALTSHNLVFSSTSLFDQFVHSLHRLQLSSTSISTFPFSSPHQHPAARITSQSHKTSRTPSGVSRYHRTIFISVRQTLHSLFLSLGSCALPRAMISTLSTIISE